MNLVLPLGPIDHSVQVVHCISEYDRETDELRSESDIPRFLDSLALKIAEADDDDPEAAFSYELAPRQLTTFSFLLGLQTRPQQCDYFLEPATRKNVAYPDEKVRAISVFEKLAGRSINSSRRTRRITESELTVPTLRVLEESEETWTQTTDLIQRLTEIFRPAGADAAILAGRSDTYFSQKVRNMISHRQQPSSFIHQGLAEYAVQKHGLRITDLGRRLVRALRT